MQMLGSLSFWKAELNVKFHILVKPVESRNQHISKSNISCPDLEISLKYNYDFTKTLYNYMHPKTVQWIKSKSHQIYKVVFHDCCQTVTFNAPFKEAKFSSTCNHLRVSVTCTSFAGPYSQLVTHIWAHGAQVKDWLLKSNCFN